MADVVVAADVVVVVAVVALAPVAVAVPALALAPALAVALASSHALSCLTISNPYVNEAPAPNCDLAGALFFQLECETKSDT
ncbi:hypothetical protein QIH01_16765 [Brevibacillus brevis]|nr:hypothetical protein QIH01_16765 [Brevibacillus brevis]